jgi:S-DNA-T family DNA segregation ATPase FtsK/SpoIIIE
MSQNTYKPKNTIRETEAEKTPRKKQAMKMADKWKKFSFALGVLTIGTALFLIIALVSHLFTGSEDQSLMGSGGGSLREAGKEAENWAGYLGALASHWIIRQGMGFSMLLFPFWMLSLGYKLVFSRPLSSIPLFQSRILLLILFIALFSGNFAHNTGLPGADLLSGAVGYEIARFINEMIGMGSWFLIASMGVLIAVFAFDVHPDQLSGKAGSASKSTKPAGNEGMRPESAEETADQNEEQLLHPDITNRDAAESAPDQEEEVESVIPAYEPETIVVSALDGLQIEVGAGRGDQEISDTRALDENFTAEQLQEKFGLFDPTLELSGYKFPPLDLLQHHGTQDLEINTDEIEYNKNRIIETLRHYNITIASIKATVGPTVTLFEIVPDAGIRISKIKSLEDDIAMSLEALGIRIIAPIPGKGTIGIEVPTKNRLMVSTRSVMATEKFVKSDLDLPIVLGKTISNEVFIADLAKMPHLLVAGATGQGKSVGINVLLTSLLYKKHPSQLKLVLVDPKKVEMSLYSKLERHFLAALPDADECIITDTKKVVNTLNSLCIEMDTRYSLLKDAQCRNIKEYNQKFRERRLNPENGHRFLPFIVLIIDELADLMMTAGKEVETPIARLAQLARAIGIHLIVATQRPSVNVITGVIKANFPARLSFRVSSKIDSRTILDQGGADQLVPGGDMLLSMGSDIVRIQCPFISTSEVENICDYIGNQRGYEMAYLLPEAPGDETGSGAEFDPSDLDPLLEEAARLIVAHQQGSTSLIQRKMKLGYNRAGRLIDQMESLGIVGPFEGSKARQVLVDEYRLEQIFKDKEA